MKKAFRNPSRPRAGHMPPYLAGRQLETDEFSDSSVQEAVEKSRELLQKPFSSSHVNQMLASLSQAGLVYKNRHGKYSFAVPLLGEFIQRQERE